MTDSLSGAQGAAFPETRLSLVGMAGRPDAPGFREAWERFFRGYWPPLYAYLRRTGSPPEEAVDCLQDFFVEGLEGKILSRYEAGRGKFRTFLLACLRNFRTDGRRHEKARPDRVRLEFLDAAESTFEPAVGDPDRAFETEWAHQVLARSIEDLEKRFAATGDSVSLRILREWLLGEERPVAGDLAASLGISTGDLYTRATRLRQSIAAEVEAQVRNFSDDARAERNEILSFIGG